MSLMCFFMYIYIRNDMSQTVKHDMVNLQVCHNKTVGNSKKRNHFLSSTTSPPYFSFLVATCAHRKKMAIAIRRHLGDRKVPARTRLVFVQTCSAAALYDGIVASG